MERIHRSVLLEECMHFLKPEAGRVYVDGTFGLGGHSAEILLRSAPDGKVVAFEWDDNALRCSTERLQEFAGRLTIIRRNFAELAIGLEEAGLQRIDGLLIDIGLSSLQLDMGGDRGFSFQRDEALDMRMDSRNPTSAQAILATCSEQELADIFFYYGEERQARPIAEAIVNYREKEKICSTKQLVSKSSRRFQSAFIQKGYMSLQKCFRHSGLP